MAFLYLNIESCAVHWRLLQLLRAILLRSGSHQSMPGADVSPQAQQAAILRQLQVHFDLPQAVEPSTDTPPEPHSQPSESHPPEPEAPADPPTERQILLPSTTTPLIRHYIYFFYVFMHLFFLVEMKSQYFGTIYGIPCVTCLCIVIK
ncbi:hypothetical protein CK203_015831 [Vitis vinifera]|uniref:Uncharacterized protein n=1 Tax=Vitis vinifera TaxID=29760 RepID=A0A438JR49_VITVI|nr:hypothetical protein CK203_015831 [Vitis vinifera]